MNKIKFFKTILLIILLVLFFSNTAIFSWQYNGQKNTFYYTVDFPDSGSWNLVDDSKSYNAFFQNGSRDAFAEVTVYDLISASNNMELLDSFVRRFNMQGKSSNVTFCKYNAVRGTYTFKYNNTNLKIDIVVFKDNYFYYVVMAYCYDSKFESYKSELKKIINSCKIYYDNGVIYANNEDTEEGYNTKQTLDNKEVDDGQYTIHIKYDKATEVFKFLNEDLAKAKEEINEIGTYKGNYWNGWTYFNIDFSDPDYEFVFWSKFYQEMFNKNYYRVNDVYDHFKIKSKNMSSYELAVAVMKCLQVIPYERPRNLADKDSGAQILDFFSPNEVAYYNKGDCDTKSLFMVIVLRRLGYDALMFHSAHYSHAMVGININASGTYKTYNGKKYYFIESTYPGWRIGDLPPQMNDTSKWRVIPIK